MNKKKLMYFCEKCREIYEIFQRSDGRIIVHKYKNLCSRKLLRKYCPECDMRCWPKLRGKEIFFQRDFE